MARRGPERCAFVAGRVLPTAEDRDGPADRAAGAEDRADVTERVALLPRAVAADRFGAALRMAVEDCGDEALRAAVAERARCTGAMDRFGAALRAPARGWLDAEVRAGTAERFGVAVRACVTDRVGAAVLAGAESGATALDGARVRRFVVARLAGALCVGVTERAAGAVRVALGAPERVVGVVRVALGAPERVTGAVRVALGAPERVAGAVRVALAAPERFARP